MSKILLTPIQASAKMRHIMEEFHDDPEALHGDADDLLCEILESLGYVELVKLFN